MIGPTKAFVAYRNLSQAHLDFVVIVCHAMPALEADIALPNADLTYPPDYFKAAKNPKAWVAARTRDYQDELARSTLITVFSYFEAYVHDVLAEMIKYHGGADKFLALSNTRAAQFLRPLSATTTSNKRKLQDNPTRAKLEKYQKYARLLDKEGFRFPTDLLAKFGVRFLLEKAREKNGMRAWEIPHILEDGLLFTLDAKDRELFEDARKLRNKIGHGKPPKLLFKDALRYASELHTFAAKIERHMIEYFFVIQAV